jgi:hypothetical protein
MNPTYGYIYIRNHPSYYIDKACKMGKTTNIPQRDTQYATGEIKRGWFELVFEVVFEQMGIIERLLQNEFNKLNIKYDAGTEFYDIQITNLIEPYLFNLRIKYKKLSKQEISDLLRPNRVRNTIKKINIKSLILQLKLLGSKYQFLESQNDQFLESQNDQYIWNQREYQTMTIEFAKKELLLKNKIYIELPTGGGKSYIIYNLLKYLKSEFIIIVSPRIIVNSQNITQKYLSILDEKYNVFNYSNPNPNQSIDEFLKLTNKKIIICCTNSIGKIYKDIISNNQTDITVWFDEAHWKIEKWIDNSPTLIQPTHTPTPTQPTPTQPTPTPTHTQPTPTPIQFWLFDNKYIKYRLFTSASPNRQKVKQNKHIFGKLYMPIKISKLINLNWLSNCKPYVYSENKSDVNNIKYIFNDFNNSNRKFGFSFHNKQKNAFELFNKHYTQYKNNKTHIKPFLLVSNNFTVEKEPKLKDIILDYAYTDIKTYESTIYSIGYVVAKYSMGYDFNKLDFICVSDPKLSSQDIIQCIGRGLRPDGQGPNSSNKEKILILSLPVYVDQNHNYNHNHSTNHNYNHSTNNYDKIIEVLKYLLHDVEIPFDQIKFKNRHKTTMVQKDLKLIDYEGSNDIKSVILDLLKLSDNKIMIGTTYNEAKKIIRKANIKSKEEYFKLCTKDNRLSNEPENIFKGQFTNWIDYLNIKRIYYDLETCKIQISKYLLSNPKINNLDLAYICNELCMIDILFPPNDLWTEYYNVKDLRDIITITNKKKKINIAL